VERLPQISAWSAALLEFPWGLRLRSPALEAAFRALPVSSSEVFNFGDSKHGHRVDEGKERKISPIIPVRSSENDEPSPCDDTADAIEELARVWSVLLLASFF
jgi:hypothetical protein